MNFWERRKLRKAVHHVLHEARHARHLREDIAAPEKIDRILKAEEALRAAWDLEDTGRIDQAADELAEAVHAVMPPAKHPRARENIEILVVAIAVAMAFRTFFVQPFRIPTGSMQPTLNGITYTEQSKRGLMDYFPLSVVPFLLFGERYVEVKAQASGLVDFRDEYTEESYVVRIAGVPHVIHKDMPRYVEVRSSVVQKGDVLAGGRKQLGDHIFVNRMRYNFAPPARGDVFVFSTREIRHPDIRPDNYYIKRLVGMPGESLRIQPPYLIADGQPVTEPPAFQRQVEGEGYDGYTLVGDTPIPALLRRPTDTVVLGPDEYLPLGDNTRASLDGRFFGGVKRDSIVGPAVMVYWPFTKRWGLID
ncbi:MAG TPA: signal peptidase I [Kiritimatiellia bacterium]|mgnify:CR=1 FL=1|nr:signal peptidase I [Kiritimatiellia bacterium]HMO97904.1 signal peptidase I [Kiritimatiellia bacterium]HMP95576.1 signal peptidase I [Kiritimatiellia bacterium]